MAPRWTLSWPREGSGSSAAPCRSSAGLEAPGAGPMSGSSLEPWTRLLGRRGEGPLLGMAEPKPAE